MFCSPRAQSTTSSVLRVPTMRDRFSDDVNEIAEAVAAAVPNQSAIRYDASATLNMTAVLRKPL